MTPLKMKSLCVSIRPTGKRWVASPSRSGSLNGEDSPYLGGKDFLYGANGTYIRIRAPSADQSWLAFDYCERDPAELLEPTYLLLSVSEVADWYRDCSDPIPPELIPHCDYLLLPSGGPAVEKPIAEVLASQHEGLEADADNFLARSGLYKHFAIPAEKQGSFIKALERQREDGKLLDNSWMDKDERTGNGSTYYYNAAAPDIKAIAARYQNPDVA